MGRNMQSHCNQEPKLQGCSCMFCFFKGVFSWVATPVSVQKPIDLLPGKLHTLRFDPISTITDFSSNLMYTNLYESILLFPAVSDFLADI